MPPVSCCWLGWMQSMCLAATAQHSSAECKGAVAHNYSLALGSGWDLLSMLCCTKLTSQREHNDGAVTCTCEESGMFADVNFGERWQPAASCCHLAVLCDNCSSKCCSAVSTIIALSGQEAPLPKHT